MLESKLGGKQAIRKLLLTRRKKGSQLTRAGQQILQQVRELLRKLNDLQTITRDSQAVSSAVNSSDLILFHSVSSHPLADGIPPEWASEWGHDEFGPWCSFDVDGIQQRVRWIPPGQFQMGLPGELLTLFADQQQQQRWQAVDVGFWMFETRCSLRLFNAVMTGTAQAVAADDGSAVNLHYGTARNFCCKLSEMLGGVAVTLPTDAQWEFSCRAGRQDGPYFDLDFDRTDSSSPWGLRSMLSGTGEFCSDASRLYSDESVVDPLGAADGVVVRGLPRSIPGVLRQTSQSTIDEKSANHFERKTHPSFRNVVDLTSKRHDVGFRCIIAENDWRPATLHIEGGREESETADASSSHDRTESTGIELNNTPLSVLLRDMASQLHRYYTELIEPVPGIESRWKLEDGVPLCEAGRRVVHSIPDSVPDSNGTPNFPDRGGRLWYLLLRTSRRAKFEDARPFLIAAAKDLAVWLNEHYSNELPHKFVVGDLPLPLRIDNLRTILTLRNLSASQRVGTGTRWPADQHLLHHAAVEVLVAIPDAITAPDGTPNFPGVGSALWPQLKNLVMTPDDSPTQSRQRSEVAQQFREWLTNRYSKDLLEATGIQATSASHKNPVQAENTIGSTKEKFDVYLSYNVTDREVVERLVLEFKKRGLTVLLDPEMLTSGDDLSTVLHDAIRDSRCIVFCVSKSGLGLWQRAEIDTYMRQLPDLERDQFHERAIPILLPGAPDPHDTPASWNSALWLDFRSGIGDSELDQLVSSIQAKINTDR